MTKVIAILALAALSMLNTMAMYWFVFGLWPRSWPLCGLFSGVTLLLAGLLSAAADAKH